MNLDSTGSMPKFLRSPAGMSADTGAGRSTADSCKAIDLVTPNPDPRRWNKSHPNTAKSHFASAPQNMLPRRCWNKPRARTPANPVDSTIRVTVCA